MPAPTLNIGPYLYLPRHQLDETKMSTIWAAQEQKSGGSQAPPGGQVVLKIARMSDTKYSLTNQRAIENEEKWLTSLRHPNIVHLRPVAEARPSRQKVYRARSELPGNPWFLVTDFLSGGDLSSLLAERSRLPAALALEIVEQVANALIYIHQNGCVHCDIKPRNILFRRKPEGYALTPETQPIVIDFGIAKSPVDGRQLVSGTPRWITPEMSEAMRVGTKLEVDPSWDVYALGLVLYNAITGFKPKIDLPGPDAWERISAADLERDATVGDARALALGLNKLIMQTTAEERNQRLDAATFAAEVQQLRRLVRIPTGTTRQPDKGRSTGTGAWLVATLALLGLLLVGTFFWRENFGGAETGAPPTAAMTGAASGDASDAPAPPDPDEPPAPATLPPVAVAPATTATATATPPEAPTATPPPTATRTPTPNRATPTRLPTSTPSVVTSTPLPTSTAVPSATAAPRATPRPTVRSTGAAGLTPDLTVSLLKPAPNDSGHGLTSFQWQPDRTPGANDCYELRFWEGGEDQWATGFGLMPYTRNTSVTIDLGEELERSLKPGQLRPNTTYFWGILQVPCDHYRRPERIMSKVQRFTYNSAPAD